MKKIFSSSIVHIPLHRYEKPERDKYTELRTEFEKKHLELRAEFEKKHLELRTELEKKHAEFEQAQTIKYNELVHTRDVLQYNTLKLLHVMERGTEL